MFFFSHKMKQYQYVFNISMLHYFVKGGYKHKVFHWSLTIIHLNEIKTQVFVSKHAKVHFYSCTKKVEFPGFRKSSVRTPPDNSRLTNRASAELHLS